MRHTTRAHPEGRFQCTGCRAAFATQEGARASKFECPGEPLAHGHPYEREHVLYPFSYNRGDGYGPDRLCDVVDCPLCVGHSCDCEVCADQLNVPSLKVLNDSHEHGNRKRSPNWEEVDKMEDLKTMLARVKAGDYVTAFGKSTTGGEVTRTGVLLAEPQDMKATHNGEKVPAIRVRVGEEGTDPAKRSTWTTLIPGHGSIRPAERPTEQEADQYSTDLEQGRARGLDYGEAHDYAESKAKSRKAIAGTSEPGEAKVWVSDLQAATVAIDPEGVVWQDTELRACISSSVFLYGGKGGKNSSGPSQAVKVSVTYTEGGAYELRHLETSEVVATLRLQSRVWWAPMPADHYAPEGGYGKPVHHVDTGELVGFWTPERFTPVEEVPGYRVQ
ncbi:hypothetical protein [Streptomyces sp. NPDC013187]|uniref:hypothetical protein n=1 Tax=Streptomyces sp. NPDC013187 TaxID=3364865 RepID=UPI003688629C